MRLEGKVALITGTASGIGRATALRFASEGARIVAVDFVGGNHETVELIRAAGGEATAVHADVSDDADVASAVKTAEETYGRLDVAFNNAGIMLADDSDSIATSEETIDKTLAVNLKGVLYGCRHQIPAMRRAGGGSIINTASFVAVIHARENIRVNALSPGPLRTEMLMSYLDTEEKRQRRLVHVPMGRFGEATEMASAALFLASADSSYMTGANLQVDGGLTAAYVTPE